MLNVHRSHSTIRNTSTEVPAAKQTESNKNEACKMKLKFKRKKSNN